MADRFQVNDIVAFTASKRSPGTATNGGGAGSECGYNALSIMPKKDLIDVEGKIIEICDK